jgi:hypothetical protein
LSAFGVNRKIDNNVPQGVAEDRIRVTSCVGIVIHEWYIGGEVRMARANRHYKPE